MLVIMYQVFVNKNVLNSVKYILNAIYIALADVVTSGSKRSKCSTMLQYSNSIPKFQTHLTADTTVSNKIIHIEQKRFLTPGTIATSAFNVVFTAITPD